MYTVYVAFEESCFCKGYVLPNSPQLFATRFRSETGRENMKGNAMNIKKTGKSVSLCMMMFAASVVNVVTVLTAKAASSFDANSGITWSYVVEGGQAKIFGSKWEDYDDEEGEYVWEYAPAIPSDTRGAITVPQTLGGYPVTEIGDGAFTECEYLTAVNVPNGVMRIGKDAFSDCTTLSHVTLPDGLTSIDGDAFDGCESLLSIDIPGTVTWIGDNAFADCRRLSSIYIPQSVTGIGRHAFARCTGLSRIQVPMALKSAVKSGEVFYRCTAKVEYYGQQTGGGTLGGGGTSDVLYGKARTIQGVCYEGDGESVYGTTTVKFGKITKKRQVKVSMAVSPLVGKKQTASGSFIADDDGSLSGSLKFKSPIGVVDFTAFKGDSGDLEFFVESESGFVCEPCSVGGKFDVSQLAFYVDGDDIDFGEEYEQILDFPDGEPIYVKNGTKFSFDKAPKISYKRFREDGETWYELTGFDDENKTNYSALKLTYTAKTGVFKGSFKIYTSNEGSIDEGKAPKLKTYTAKVSGVVIDGFGIGSATVKVGKKSYTMQVSIGDACDECSDDDWEDDWGD